MSTLTTRIAGYRFVVRQSDNVWPDGKGIEGRFFSDESDDVMALPYELRSTYVQQQGQTYALLLAATSDVANMRAEEYFDCGCGDIGHRLCLRCREAKSLIDSWNNLLDSTRNYN